MSRLAKVVYKNTIDTENIDAKPFEEVETESEIKEIPDSRLYGMNLKKIPAFQKNRTILKVDNQKILFLARVSKTLELVTPEENKTCRRKLLIMICNSAETHFIYGSKQVRESSKQECIISVMLPFFETEEALLYAIETIKHKIK